jgi:hypothetical protein
MFVPSIHFVQRRLGLEWPQLWKTSAREIDLHPERFAPGETCWVLQTYLRCENQLRERGLRVTIGERLAPNAINIAHRDALNRWFAPYFANYIVSIRADRPKTTVCNWEIVQNGLEGEKPKTSTLALWPQPGLVGRAAGRGLAIERAAYFGRLGTTTPWLVSASFAQSMRRLGVSFSADSPNWHDYSSIDLVIAHREEAPCMLVQKPASKLINAWLAGVPALLNDEPAFRELRRSQLDYVAIDSAEDVLKAVTRLKTQPMLYQAMVENGFKRAQEFSVAAMQKKWLGVLCEQVVPDAERYFARGENRGLRLIWQVRQVMRQHIDSRRFRETYRKQMASIRNGRSDAALARIG